MEVYSSFSNIVNFNRSKISLPSIYKRYALIYDHIIFNRYSCPIGEGDLFPTLASYVSTIASDEPELKDKLALGQNNKFKSLFVDMWDMVEDPEKTHYQAREYVSEFDEKQISKFSWGRNLIDEEMGIHNHHAEYKAAAIVAGDLTSDLGFNFLLKDKFNSFQINFAPIISEVFSSSQETTDISTLFSTDIVIPNFEKLSWDQILELREDKYIKQFRDKIHSYSNSAVAIDEILSNDLNSALWDIAEQCKPNIGKSIFEAVISNLPSPTVVNPFGLYYGAREVIKNQQNNKHDWVYFVQSMKKES